MHSSLMSLRAFVGMPRQPFTKVAVTTNTTTPHTHLMHSRPKNRVSCRVERSEASYLETARQCENNGDIIAAVELFTEARLLQVQLPAEAIEAGVRTFAKGGQWQRALALFQSLEDTDAQRNKTTITAVVSALTQGKQLAEALALLNNLASQNPAPLSDAYNVLVRAMAANEKIQDAVDLLNCMAVDDRGVRISYETYNYVATRCIKAGMQEIAEEVLEIRDYL